ncbi:Ubiquitin carboxyl-terminal hydrolase MINDY-1 [Geranomyces michiganensis]|nr:Ubiquitin carboxyl-terminal hydrolase MINDY-1 [Geranomyces michiganensis]
MATEAEAAASSFEAFQSPDAKAIRSSADAALVPDLSPSPAAAPVDTTDNRPPPASLPLQSGPPISTAASSHTTAEAQPSLAAQNSPTHVVTTSQPVAQQPPLQRSTPHHSPPQADKLYRLKRIIYIDSRTNTPQRLSIITQNRNGPCPLLALTNVLILRGEITIPHHERERGEIAYEQILAVVGDWLTSRLPAGTPTAATAGGDFSQNLTDVFEILPTLQTGLDVNVRFSSPTSFELTPALLVFDAFNITLCHGWTVDPQDTETYAIVVDSCGSYNAVVEKIIQADVAATAQRSDKGKKPTTHANNYQDDDSDAAYFRTEQERSQTIHDGLVCSQFLATTSSQLTYHGLQWLCDDARALPVGVPAVLFRNNHFHTILKRVDGCGGGGTRLYTLVTDQGFLHAEGAVWETMSGVDGDSSFVDGYFVPFAPDGNANASGGAGGGNGGGGDGGRVTVPGGVIGPGDYADAPSPTISHHHHHHHTGDDGDAGENADLALAIALQQEEEEQFAAAHAAGAYSPDNDQAGRNHSNNNGRDNRNDNNNSNNNSGKQHQDMASPKSPKSPHGKKDKCAIM